MFRSEKSIGHRHQLCTYSLSKYKNIFYWTFWWEYIGNYFGAGCKQFYNVITTLNEWYYPIKSNRDGKSIWNVPKCQCWINKHTNARKCTHTHTQAISGQRIHATTCLCLDIMVWVRSIFSIHTHYYTYWIEDKFNSHRHRNVLAQK